MPASKTRTHKWRSIEIRIVVCQSGIQWNLLATSEWKKIVSFLDVGKVSSYWSKQNYVRKDFIVGTRKKRIAHSFELFQCKNIVLGEWKLSDKLLDKSNAQIKQINVLEARTKQLQFGVQQNTDNLADNARQPRKENQLKDESTDIARTQNSEEDTTFLSSLERFCTYWRLMGAGVGIKLSENS